MRHLGIERAHVRGLFHGRQHHPLNFGIAHPDVSESLAICACGSGTVGRETFPLRRRKAGAAISHGRASRPRCGASPGSPHGAASPRRTRAAGPSSSGRCATTRPWAAGHMLRGVQMKRKTVFGARGRARAPRSALAHRRGRSGRALPRARPLHEAPHPPRGARHPADDGDTRANIEEPGLFNLHVAEFLAAVENGRWGTWKAEKPARRSRVKRSKEAPLVEVGVHERRRWPRGDACKYSWTTAGPEAWPVPVNSTIPT